MEYLADLLSRLSGDSGAFRIAFVVTVSLAFFIFGFGIMYLVSVASDPLRKRVRSLGGHTPVAAASGTSSIVAAFEPLEPYILPSKDWERNRINTKLVHAGFRAPNALTTFYVIKTLLLIVLSAAVIILAPLFPSSESSQVFIAIGVAAGIGLLVPNIVLERLVERRMKRIRNGFPDALDLLVVCSEAGLGLNAAIDRVGRELDQTYPELSEELILVNAEIMVGVDRTEALHNLAHRTGLEDIRGLVALLTQSLRLGTGVAETLRIYSEEFRDKRMQRAEEQAAKIGTKMIFPLVTCLFPGFFVVIIGPAILKIIAVFGGLK